MKVSLISLNLNGGPFIGNFLESVHAEISMLANAELILLDNGSTDHSIELITSRYPWVRLIQLPRNVGFCRGCHEAAKQSDSDILIFLNNDMVLEPGFVEEIILPLTENSSIGVSAGLVLNEAGTQIDYAGGDINVFGWGFQRHHKMMLDDFETEFAMVNTNRQFFACGGALAISRKLWNESGGFDPDYFAFFEDVDFGWRLNIMGYSTVLANRAKVRHVHHGTASSMPQSMRTYLVERNAMMSIIKNYDDCNLAKILPWAIAMINERSLIDTGTVYGDIFKGRWADDVFARGEIREPSEILNEIQSAGKSGLKKARDILTGDYSGKRQPVRYLAIEHVFLDWENLMRKREIVQKSRKVNDSEIVELMGERFRTVLGHSREKKLMEIFQKNV